MSASQGEVAKRRESVHRDRICDISPSSASEPWAMLASTGYAIAVYAMFPYHLFVSRQCSNRDDDVPLVVVAERKLAGRDT